MTTNEALAIFRDHITKMKALNHAMGILSYDGATTAPAESAEGRGKTLAYLSNCAYEIETAPELKQAADFLNARRSSWATWSC